MNTRQLKAAAASIIIAGVTGVALAVATSPAQAWPCIPRCGTPVSPAPSVAPSGPAGATPITTVGPGGARRR